MKNSLKRSIVVSMFSIACCMSLYAFTFERSIEGTWRTVVTPINCQTGVPVASPFPGLLTFNKGGTLTGTSTVAASVYGVWEMVRGSQNYNFAFTNFRYDPAGVLIGSQVVRQDASMDESRDDFTSTGTVQMLDINGNVVGNGCARSTGSRFQ
jgi:hypothetical protein